MYTKYLSTEKLSPDFFRKEIEKSILHNSNDFGLLHGQTGLCITSFLLSDLFPENGFKELATQLLDTICDNICDVELLDFENGLAGIGWGMEWIVQNGYIQTDTNEVLEDLDDELYKAVVCVKSPTISLNNGSIGKAMYFFKRLIALNQPSLYTRYRNICNQECLVLLIDEMNEFLFGDDSGLLKTTTSFHSMPSDKMIDMAHALIFLSKIYPHRVNLEITEKIIRGIFSFIQQHKKYVPEIQQQEGYLHLLYAYSFANKLLNNVNGVKHARLLFNEVNQQIPTNEISLFQAFFKNNFNSSIHSTIDVNYHVFERNYCTYDLLFICNKQHKNMKRTWNEAWLLS